jgi:hypothetical protein
MALTLDTFKTSSTKNLTPTPRPQLQESKPESEGVTASRPDQSTLSEEARQGEAAASSNSPVNFAAWDSPAPVEGETKVEGVNNSPAAAKATNALGTATLKKGMRSDEVRALQEMLKSNGADIGVDGIFGKDTLKAVQEFQKSQGLEVDGLVGKDTRKALEGLGATAQDSQAQAQDQPVKAEEATAQAEEVPLSRRKQPRPGKAKRPTRPSPAPTTPPGRRSCRKACSRTLRRSSTPVRSTASTPDSWPPSRLRKRAGAPPKRSRTRTTRWAS